MAFDYQKAKNVLQKIKNDEGAKLYLFKNMHSPEWFDILEDAGFLKPENNPGPIKTDENRWSVPRWLVLSFLEKLTDFAIDKNDEVLILKISNFIKSCAEYRDAEGYPIDNSTTWWVFANLIIKFPIKFVDEKIINSVPVFIGGKFDNSLTGSELAKNLLPRLLKETNNFEMAEKLFGYLTDYKFRPSKYKKYDGLETEEAYPFLDSFWLNHAFIESGILVKLGRVCSEAMITSFINKFENLLVYENLPKLYAPKAEILVGNIFKISYLSKGRVTVEWDVSHDDGDDQGQELSSSFSVGINLGKENFITEFLLNSKAVKNDDLIWLLSKIYEDLYDDYSYTYIRKIGESSPGDYKEFKNVYVKMLLEIIKGRKLINSEITKKYLALLFENPFPLMKRIAIYFILENWNVYKQLFFEKFKKYNVELLNNQNYESEMHDLFKSRCREFNSQQLMIITKAIEQGPDITYESENKEIFSKYWKQKWYSSLKELPEILEKYTSLKEITKTNEHFNSEQSAFWVGNVSPITQKDINEITNSEFIEYIYNFKPEFGPNQPSFEGLSTVFKNAVSENPRKYFEDLNPFLKAPYIFVSSLVSGFEDALKNDKQLDWQKILSFFNEYFKNDEFWENKYTLKSDFSRSDFEWVVSSFAWFVRNALGVNNLNAIPANKYDVIKDIFQVLIAKTSIKKSEPKDRPLGLHTYVLNTNFGRILSVFIHLYINEFNSNLESEEKKKIINQYYRGILEPLFQRDYLEALFITGENMKNIFMMDKSWFDEIHKNALKKESVSFLAFMEGYLCDHWVSKPVFDEFLDCYTRMINEPKMTESNQKDLMVHLGVVYLNGNKTEQSFCLSVVDNWKPSFIVQLINYFYSVENETAKNTEHTNKVLEFWKYLNKAYVEKKREDAYVIGTTTLLTNYLHELDKESLDLLRSAAQNSDNSFKIYKILESLNRLKNSADISSIAEDYSEIMLKMLNTLNEFQLQYKFSDFKEIIEYFNNSKLPKPKSVVTNFRNKCLSLGITVFDDLYKALPKNV